MYAAYLYIDMLKLKMLELIKKCGQGSYFDQIKQRAAGWFNIWLSRRLNSGGGPGLIIIRFDWVAI